jgi:shikimate kinase
MLHEVGEFEDVVISVGGGTPCFFDNVDYMNSVGETVFLDVDIRVLFRRLKIAKHQRPLLDGKSDEELMQFIQEALQSRLPFYTRAKHTFNGEKLEDRRQIQQSVERLKELLKL